MPRRSQLSETDFQTRLIETARLAGWRVVHFRPGMTQRGRWVTPMQGDKGAPDLILAKDGRVLLAELKSDTGRPTAQQVAWLSAAGGHGRLWRPADWEAILLDLGVTKPAPLSAAESADRRRELTADAAGEGTPQ